ncbi:hypothetical protein YC2023_046510 [Brassica napus]
MACNFDCASKWKGIGVCDQLVYEVLGVTYVEIWNNWLHFFVDFSMLWIQISTKSELLQD